jgi:hypothetical protein
MTESWSIREELFKIKRYHEYPLHNIKGINMRKQTLMTVALKNAGLLSTTDAGYKEIMYYGLRGGIF